MQNFGKRFVTTENSNAFMEQYVRQYTDYSQEDIYKWLAMAEFAANNAVNASTKVTPFFANKGFHPHMSFSPPQTVERNSSKSLRKQISAGTDFSSKMAEVLNVLLANLTHLRDRQESASSANQSPAPAY